MSGDKKISPEEQYINDTQKELNDSFDQELNALRAKTENEERHKLATSGRFFTKESLEEETQKNKKATLEIDEPKHEGLFFSERGGSKDASDTLFDKEREDAKVLAEREKERIKIRESQKRDKSQEQEKKTEQIKTEVKQPSKRIESVARRYDRIKQWQDEMDRKRFALEKELEKKIASNDNAIGRFSGKLNKLQTELESQKHNLANIDQRMAEQTGKLNKEIEETRPSDYWGEPDKSKLKDLLNEKSKPEEDDLDRGKKEEQFRQIQLKRQRKDDRDLSL